MTGAGNRFSKALKANKELAKFRMAPEPLLNFAISYLAVSSPPVQVYNSGIIEKQLKDATYNYVSNNLLIKNVPLLTTVLKSF